MLNYSKILKEITKIYSLIPYFFLNGYAFSPLHIFFLITNKCNLYCKMCQWLQGKNYNWLNAESKENELTLAEIGAIVKQVPGQALISFSGGEPFMRKDMLDILIQVSQSNKCHIITNGTLLSEQDCKALVNLGPKNLFQKGLILMGVSVHSPDEGVHDKITASSGSFQKTIQAIKEIVRQKKHFKKNFPLINMKIVVSQDNVNRLVEYLQLAESLGVDICNFMLQHNIIEKLAQSLQIDKGCDIPPSRLDLDDIQVLIEQLNIILSKKNNKVQIRISPEVSISEIIQHYRNKIDLRYYKCISPWSRLYIHPHGNSSLCYYCDSGNLRTQSIKSAWNSDAFVQFRRRLKKAKIFPDCVGCCQLNFDSRGQKAN